MALENQNFPNKCKLIKLNAREVRVDGDNDPAQWSENKRDLVYSIT